jgi:HTH-type transcriptional regulator / antitoxin HigA
MQSEPRRQTDPAASLSARDYDRLVATLDTLIDLVGEDESHPLATMMDVIGTLIASYEDAHIPEPGSAG